MRIELCSPVTIVQVIDDTVCLVVEFDEPLGATALDTSSSMPVAQRTAI
jgi:hypothetical protein